MTLADPDPPQPALIASFALMEAEPGAMDRFRRLIAETAAYQQRLKALGRLDYPMWTGVADGVRVATYLIPQIAPKDRDESLFARWAAWTLEYERIVAASPKWRMKTMISLVSETHHCMSWPNRWERDVLIWAMAEGEEPPCPFIDRREVLNEAFRLELQRLVRECGGFLYRCEESQQVVFAPAESLPRIWQHQDHLAAIARDKPFGFFHEMSRPDHAAHARDLTPFEEQAFRAMARPAGFRARIVAGVQRLGRRLKRRD